MKITGQDVIPHSRPVPPPRQANLPSLRRPLLTKATAMILLALAFVLGAIGQAMGWYAPLATGTRRLIRNPRFQVASAWQRSRLPTLYLDIEFQDAQRLESERQHAAQTGVHLARPGEVVTATIRIGSDAIPVQIRLPAGQYPYTGGEWAFEIHTTDERRVLGWHHLMLYSATSHRALSQWGLSESLRREDILAAPVQIVPVVLNGDALGMYGVWAAPGAEILARQGRPAGSIVYFDQTLYWQDLQRQRGNGPALTSVDLSDCQVAMVVAADVPATGMSTSNKEAMALLRALQSGRCAPSDVLDVDRLGTLLALSTLWQGAPLNDWTHLAFYSNPTTGWLEPVAMADLISAQSGNTLRWPVCFDDPIIQQAYVRAVERVSRPEYLQWLRAELGGAFEQMQLASGAESDKPELTWDDLTARQKQMARWLEPTETVLATWAISPTSPLTPDAVVQVSLANLQRVPVELLGFDVGKSMFLPIDPAWIQDGADVTVPGATGGVILRAAREGRLRALRLALPYTRVFAAGHASDEPLEMRVVTRLWGLTRQQSTLARPEDVERGE